MAPLTFTQARERVFAEVRASAPSPAAETVPLLDAVGRILAGEVRADRDYPPVARSVRDGFALRAADLPSDLYVIGEVRAGESFDRELGPREAVEIMTGAPVPRGADAVVMVEHVSRRAGCISTEQPIRAGDAINPQGSEARLGDVVLPAGRVIDFAGIGALATVGRTEVSVYRKPTVAIIATGDEIVEVGETPRDYQVRNSNACSLAIQIARAGGVPEILPVARDTYDSTRALVERGLASDLLLISGGVSAGKYDIVEKVLADCGAEFYFDRIRVQPGQPLVFGKARDRFFFGLPGNPVSTMVTFEAFARAALELVAGQADPMLPFVQARLTEPFRQRPGLTRFLPARLETGNRVTPIKWTGSSDVFAAARASAFIVTFPQNENHEFGEWVRVLLK